ncbi:Uncharacterised protein [Yersinia frederiksenii]|nr:Uncharacterised protein [Yersinia frederiksenii]
MVANCFGLAGGSVGDFRCRAASATDYTIFAIGRVVFCSFLSAFSLLVTLPFLVWQLYTHVATTPSFASWGKMESNIRYCADFRSFVVVRENLVGQGHLARYINGIADFHVTDASY